ncbi:IMP dehydrogenase / GMP reductase domain protein [Streptococcus pyogenes MGAS2111]|nr:IMP dehydrogenase / GMP reductase domain protein [Streptococcus pyogenes MGAS2111]
MIAGNIVTAEGARALYDAGVDVVKVGMVPDLSVPLVWLQVSEFLK